MSSILARLSEASSWAGISGIVAGLSSLFGLGATGDTVAHTVANVGTAVAAGTNPIVAGAMALAGLAAVLIPEGTSTPSK